MKHYRFVLYTLRSSTCYNDVYILLLLLHIYIYIYILRNELTALMVLSKLCEAQNFGDNTKSHAAES